MPPKDITIPAAEFKSLMDGMKAMQGEIAAMKKGDGPKVMRAPKEHLVTVSYINGKPVIGYVNRGTAEKPAYVYEATNPKKPTEYMLFVDLILQGQEEPIKVGYIEFMEQAERRDCVVTQTRKEPWTIELGDSVTKKEVPDGAYYTNDTGVVIPLEVKGDIMFYKVRLHDGSELELHERYVNIMK